MFWTWTEPDSRLWQTGDAYLLYNIKVPPMLATSNGDGFQVTILVPWCCHLKPLSRLPTRAKPRTDRGQRHSDVQGSTQNITGS